jgi:uncharacterized membrane protein
MALLFAGTAHLTFSRDEFRAQVPTFLHSLSGPIIFVSGVIEIVLGIALVLFWKYRVPVGAITALYLLLISVGNIAQYLNGTDAFGLDSDRARFIRLLFQPLLIAWALWSTDAWSSYKSRAK